MWELLDLFLIYDFIFLPFFLYYFCFYYYIYYFFYYYSVLLNSDILSKWQSFFSLDGKHLKVDALLKKPK